MESQLSRLPGQHLVIVFYAPTDVPSEEWIANQPDPGASKIIWARDMGAVKNEELLGAYPGRHLWFAYRNGPWPRLIPSSAATD
jgi:hypothetical protein